MTRSHQPRITAAASARGFTIVEAVISTVIVGIMLVAALNAAGMAGADRARTLWGVQGQQLAAGLMAEIMAMPYQDPALPTAILGCEAGEMAGDRTTFDDVDDFNGYTQTPPKALDGTALMSDSTWTWSVVVEWVDAASPGGAAALTESGAKRITVNVTHNGVPIATLVGLRASVN